MHNFIVFILIKIKKVIPLEQLYLFFSQKKQLPLYTLKLFYSFSVKKEVLYSLNILSECIQFSRNPFDTSNL